MGCGIGGVGMAVFVEGFLLTFALFEWIFIFYILKFHYFWAVIFIWVFCLEKRKEYIWILF